MRSIVLISNFYLIESSEDETTVVKKEKKHDERNPMRQSVSKRRKNKGP